MMVLRSGLFRASLILLGLLVFSYAALLLTVNSEPFQEWLIGKLAAQTGYEIAGELRLDPLLRLNADGVSVFKAGKRAFWTERARMVITPLVLFDKTVHRLSLTNPTLYLELDELLKDNKNTVPDIRFRHLNIVDGALLLAVARGRLIEFKSLAMNAQDIDIGEAAGLNLRAEVPWLQGVVELVVTGDENEKVARVGIKQAARDPPGNVFASKPRLRDALEAEIKVTKNPDESLAVAATGKLNRMLMDGDAFSGRFDGRADLDDNRDHAQVAAKIVATELPAKIDFLPVPLPKGTSALSFEASFSVAEKILAVRSFRLQSPLGDASGAAQLSMTPEVALADSKVSLRKVPFEHLGPLLPRSLNAFVSEGLLDAELSVRGALRALAIMGAVQGSGIKLRGEDFSLQELNFKTPVEWAGSRFFAADVQITARKLLARQKSQVPVAAEDVRMAATWEQKAGAPARAAGQLRINQARFASLDGTRIGENLMIAARFEATTHPELNDIFVNGKLDLEQGEILWGKFFADLKPQRPLLKFEADYVPGADSLRLRELNITLASVGRVAVRGAIEQTSKNPLVNLEITSDNVQPGGIFESFLRPTYNRSFPILDQFAFSGRLAFAVRATGTLDAITLEGLMQLGSGEFQNTTKKWQLGPVQLDLPIRIQYPGTSSPPISSNVPTGTLTIERARFGSEVIPAIKSTVSFWNNALRFHEAIRLPIYGGILAISDLSFRNLIDEPQAMSLALEAKNLRLERLTDALGWHRFGGTLSGSIPRIGWGSGTLRSEGKIQAQVFSGEVQISTLEIESPFSSVPSIKLDARFRDISLDQASKTFAFGQISGILEGRVNNLVITAGQPSEFRADVHTVEKRGVSQRMSVESLNKITVLSSGNDAGALYSGIASFFDTFRYSKLGFKATLKNDKLTLRGVESREDGEYLVVGSFIPPTVNVVSHTQVIAFSELLRRLAQVQESEPAAPGN
jgi:hypothetical protein